MADITPTRWPSYTEATITIPSGLSVGTHPVSVTNSSGSGSIDFVVTGSTTEWPSTLPQYADRTELIPIESPIRFKPSKGQDIVRKSASASRTSYRITFGMSESELSTFKTFYRTLKAYDYFTLPDQFLGTGSITCRFTGQPNWSAIDFDWYSVSFAVEVDA